MPNSDQVIKIPIDKVHKVGQIVPIKIGDDELTIEITGNKFPLDSNFNDVDPIVLKKPLSTDQLVEQMGKYGVTMTPEEKAYACEVLNEINYYRLSIFITFLTPDNMSFNRLIELYDFDRFLRNEIEVLLNPIEELIKTTLANHLCCQANLNPTLKEPNRPALIYLDRSIFKKDVASKDIDHMEHMFYETVKKNDRHPSIKHHKDHYGGNIPFWVLIEHLTFGNISSFINYLDRQRRKDWIDHKLKLPDGKTITGPKDLPEWVNALRILRNSCAHMDRLYSRTFPFRVNLKAVEPVKGISLTTDEFKQSLFCGLFIIRRFYLLMSNKRKTEWNIFIENLAMKIDSFNINVKRMGIEKFVASDWMI